MDYLFAGTPRELSEITKNWGFKGEISDTADINASLKKCQEDFSKKLGGIRISDAEAKSWRNSLGRLASILVRNNLFNVYLICEMALKNNSRPDVMIICKNKSKYTVFVLEIKQWQSPFQIARQLYKINTKNGSYVGMHPIKEARHYLTHLRGSFKDKEVEWLPIALLHNEKNNGSLYRDLDQEDAKNVFSDGQDILLANRISVNAKSKIAESDALKFTHDASYAICNLTEAGIAYIEERCNLELNPEQNNALEIIESKINNPNLEKNVIIVNGVPGSGKTLLALKTVKIAQSNNKRKRGSFQYRLAVGGISTRRIFYGIAKSGDSESEPLSSICYHNQVPHTDVAVIDEGHRIRSKLIFGMGDKIDKDTKSSARQKNIIELIDSTTSTIIFQDQSQSLRRGEGINKNWIQKYYRKHNRSRKRLTITEISLGQSERFPLAKDYVSWVDKFSRGLIEGWHNPNYIIRIAESLEELEEFYRSNNSDRLSTRNLIVGRCSKSKNSIMISGRRFNIVEPIDILDLDHNNDYKFHAEADFNLIGTAYQCYNFEYDYAIVYMPQFVKLGKNWRIDGELYDLGNQIPNKNISNLIRLLMTRGTAGTMLYIEDDKTRDIIKKIMSQ